MLMFLLVEREMPVRNKIQVDQNQIYFKLIMPEHFAVECDLCLSHHPFTKEGDYSPLQLQCAINGKSEFLNKVYETEGFI